MDGVETKSDVNRFDSLTRLNPFVIPFVTPLVNPFVKPFVNPFVKPFVRLSILAMENLFPKSLPVASRLCGRRRRRKTTESVIFDPAIFDPVIVDFGETGFAEFADAVCVSTKFAVSSVVFAVTKGETDSLPV